MLSLCGAELHLVEAVPYKDPGNYVRYSETLSKKIKNLMEFFGLISLIIYQIKKSHYLTTGPEIWSQLKGKVDAFICSVGTGGTLAGTSQYLKEKQQYYNRFSRPFRFSNV